MIIASSLRGFEAERLASRLPRGRLQGSAPTLSEFEAIRSTALRAYVTLHNYV